MRGTGDEHSASEATPNGVGDYTATFPGVSQEAGALLVTGQGEAASCTTARWVLDRAHMTVGAEIDSGFSVSYNVIA